MPKISIITCLNNNQNALKQCIESVLAQSFEDFEFILINNSSCNKSLEIAEKFAIYDDRIKIYTKENETQGTIKNFALKKAQGEMVYYLNSDDCFEKNAFLKLYENFKEKNPDIILFNIYKYSENIKNKTPYSCIENYYAKFKDGIFSPLSAEDILFDIEFLPSRVYNRNFLMKNDIKYPNTKLTDDLEFSLRAHLNADRISCLDEYILDYKVHKNLKTISKDDKIKALYNSFFAFEEIFEKSKYRDNAKIQNSFLNYQIKQLFTYFSLVDNKNKKNYYNLLKKIIIYIKNKYDIKFIKKSSYSAELIDIIKYNYEIYKIKRKLSTLKTILKGKIKG